MRKMVLLSLLFAYLIESFPLGLIVGQACQRIGPVSLDKMCLTADAIVRAAAIAYAQAPEGDVRELNVPRKVSVQFQVKEVIKGAGLPSEMTINGYLTSFDDFNDRPVPYDFVRPGGRRGNCTAYEYKKGAEFLLFLKKIEGQLSPYWEALAPTNEQLYSTTDPWLLWVRERHKTLEKEKGKRESSHEDGENRQTAALCPAPSAYLGAFTGIATAQ